MSSRLLHCREEIWKADLIGTGIRQDSEIFFSQSMFLSWALIGFRYCSSCYAYPLMVDDVENREHMYTRSIKTKRTSRRPLSPVYLLVGSSLPLSLPFSWVR